MSKCTAQRSRKCKKGTEKLLLISEDIRIFFFRNVFRKSRRVTVFVLIKKF